MGRYILVYDADCGPCTRFKRLLEFLDVYGRVGFASLVDADRQGRLDSISPYRRHRSFHLIFPNGRVLSGTEALPELVALLPGGRVASKMTFSTPLGYGAVELVYSTFVRLHDRGSCTYRASGLRVVHEKRTGIIGSSPTLPVGY